MRALAAAGRVIESSEAAAGLSELAVFLGDLRGADDFIQLLTKALLDERWSQLQQPGLAYWRTININQTLGKSEIVAQLIAKAEAYERRTLAILTTPQEQKTFTDQLWYIKAIHEWSKPQGL